MHGARAYGGGEATGPSFAICELVAGAEAYIRREYVYGGDMAGAVQGLGNYDDERDSLYCDSVPALGSDEVVEGEAKGQEG